MIKASLLVLAAIAVFFAETSLAQEHPTVERPDLKVGDSWTYQKINNWRGIVRGIVQDKYTLEVSATSGTEIHLARKSETSGAVATVTETPDLNTIRGISFTTGAAIQFSPDTETFAFPLRVGKTWKAKADYATGDHVGSYTLTTKVVGWETVKVQAGEFTALKITQDGYYKSTMGTMSGSGRMQETFWYAPAVDGVVKVMYKDTNWAGQPYNRFSAELLTYKIN
ncbi:hypothetical protein [Thiomonas sp.]